MTAEQMDIVIQLGEQKQKLEKQVEQIKEMLRAWYNDELGTGDIYMDKIRDIVDSEEEN